MDIGVLWKGNYRLEVLLLNTLRVYLGSAPVVTDKKLACLKPAAPPSLGFTISFPCRPYCQVVHLGADFFALFHHFIPYSPVEYNLGTLFD